MSAPLDFKRPDAPSAPAARERILAYICPADENADGLSVAWRLVVMLGLAAYTLRFALSTAGDEKLMGAFTHYVNLPFHEAGHIVFRPFGRLMASLGGSLLQLLVPLIASLVLLVRTRDGFGAGVAFWWFGQNFIDLAPYIGDARRLTLPLLGGNTGQSAPYGFHDWNYILTEFGLLRLDQTLARAAFGLGVALMVLSVAWMGAALYRLRRGLIS